MFFLFKISCFIEITVEYYRKINVCTSQGSGNSLQVRWGNRYNVTQYPLLLRFQCYVSSGYRTPENIKIGCF